MRYRLLGTKTGLRVSQVALGTLMFGNRWGYGTDIEEAKKILDAYLTAGGNIIDTADSYQSGEAEEFLGQLLSDYRNDIILATKFTEGAVSEPTLSSTGNSRKNMMRSVEDSLKRLKTDHIDLFWVHMPDGVTPVDEILRGLDDLARAGKILYAGFSDFQAWRTARAQTIAEIRGTVPISSVQLEYSLVERTGERELLPMADALGMAKFVWSPLGGGALTGKYRKGENGRREAMGGGLFHSEESSSVRRTIDALLAVADELAVSAAQVAIAWLLAKGCIPILGSRTAGQLQENLAAVDVTLGNRHISMLDEASAIQQGFPHEFLSNDFVARRLSAGKDVILGATTPVA